MLNSYEKIEGEIEGKKAKAIEVAKNLKNMGMTIDVIQKATGLTIDDIDKI